MLSTGCLFSRLLPLLSTKLLALCAAGLGDRQTDANLLPGNGDTLSVPDQHMQGSGLDVNGSHSMMQGIEGDRLDQGQGQLGSTEAAAQIGEEGDEQEEKGRFKPIDLEGLDPK